MTPDVEPFDLPAAGGEPLSAPAAAGRMPLPLVLAFGIELASKLAELHRDGMVHNGVRPDAVRCDAATGRAWLIDFGDVSGGMALRAAPSAASMSAARLVYASPEQTGRMERVPDHRSDCTHWASFSTSSSPARHRSAPGMRSS